MKLAILPGLGADGGMYGPRFRALADEVVLVEWPREASETSLAAVAERLIDDWHLADCDAVAGSSLGGMVACEIVERIPARKLALIGSALHPSEVNSALAQIAKLRRFVPLEFLQTLLGKEPIAQNSPLMEMISRADPEFIRAMAAAIFEWPGRPEPRGDLARIHGAWDLVIRAPDAGARILPRAGHMIAMTHEAVVADWLADFLG